MGAYNVVNRAAMVTGQPEDISIPLANFDAIAAVLNGGIDNSNINAAAAIVYTKLALANSLVNGDFAAGNKVTKSLFSGGPPGGPTHGDIWIATAVDTGAEATTLGIEWMFKYNANSASTYKWEFIGGAPVRLQDTAGNTLIAANTWTEAGPGANVRYAVVRGGDYEAISFMAGAGAPAGASTQTFGVGTSAGGSPAAADQFQDSTPSGSAPYTVGVEARLNALAIASNITSWAFANAINATVTKSHLRVRPVRII